MALSEKHGRLSIAKCSARSGWTTVSKVSKRIPSKSSTHTHKLCQGVVQGFKPCPHTAFQGCRRRVKVICGTEEVTYPGAGNLVVAARLQPMEGLCKLNF